MNTLDSTIMTWVMSFHPSWWDAIMKAVSWIGYPPQTRWIMAGLAILIILILGFKRGVWVQVATMGAYLSGNLIKFLVNRPRPENFGFVAWHKGLEGGNRSFPAGHVEIFTALGITTGVFFAKKYPTWAAKIVWIIIGIYLILLGISRVYLGEHWPTDVLAGYVVGFVWALLVIKINESKSHL